MNITRTRLKEIIKEEISLLEALGNADKLIQGLVSIHKEISAGQLPDPGVTASSAAQLKQLSQREDDVGSAAGAILELWPELHNKSPAVSDFLGQRINYLNSALKRS